MQKVTLDLFILIIFEKYVDGYLILNGKDYINIKNLTKY